MKNSIITGKEVYDSLKELYDELEELTKALTEVEERIGRENSAYVILNRLHKEKKEAVDRHERQNLQLIGGK